MTQRQIFAVCFIAGLLLLLYQLLIIFRPFFLPVLWAVILAHLTFPLHRRMTALLREWETLSAGLLTLTIMALGVVPVLILAFILVKEARLAYVAFSGWITAGGLQRLPETLSALPFGSRLQEAYGWFIATQGNVEGSLLGAAKTVSGYLINEIADLAQDAFVLTVDFLVMIMTLFFLFKDGDRLVTSLYSIIPLEEAHKARILTRLDLMTRAVVKGMVVTAIAQGLLAGLAYAVLGVPFPAFLTALTTLLAPLPFGGTAIIWVPVTLYLYWVGPLWKAVAMLAWGVGVVTMVDNLLRPWLIGRGAQLPVLFLFFSILGGLAAYGMIGMFLGPILLGIFLTAAQIYREEYHPSMT
jgi:predicted PurR-regulated permease PerM